MPSVSHYGRVEMFQKGHVKTMFSARTNSGLQSEASDFEDTEFEEDFSDVEEYSGRRSEESVSCYIAARPSWVVLIFCKSLANKAKRPYPPSTNSRLQSRMILENSTSNCLRRLYHQSRSKDQSGHIFSAFPRIRRRTSISIFQCLHLPRLKGTEAIPSRRPSFLITLSLVPCP